MLVTGISNRLDNNHNLFFYEFDNVEYKDVEQEAKRLSRLYSINIAILESSPLCYHLISFDVLTHENVRRICYNVTLPSDFVHIDEQGLWGNQYEDNCLRIGRKGKKDKPKFIIWIHPETNDNYIAINHLWFYHIFCGVPIYEIPEFMIAPYKVYFVIYKTGGAKRKKWEGGLRRKPY